MRSSNGWFIMKGFCEKKFRSMLISGTFTKAVMYLMLLSDSIIAGFFIGENGVAGINAITPITAIVTFLEISVQQASVSFSHARSEL